MKIIDLFYKEARSLLYELLAMNKSKVQEDLIDESINLNRLLLKKPGENKDLTLKLSYNIYEVYNAIKNGEDFKLLKRNNIIKIIRSDKIYTDFLRWCREVVWWGNKIMLIFTTVT